MKARFILAIVVVCLAAAVVCFAADEFTGTWKLNEAKSRIAAGSPKHTTVVYEAAGDNVKVTVARRVLVPFRRKPRRSDPGQLHQRRLFAWRH